MKAFLLAGVVLPVVLHFVASDRMPWWPDTVSMGIGFGVAAVLISSKAKTDREINRRMLLALREIGRRFTASRL